MNYIMKIPKWNLKQKINNMKEKRYIFATATEYEPFQEVKKDIFYSGVTRYWYYLGETELKEFYYKSGIHGRATNFSKDFNWFLLRLLSGYEVGGIKGLKQKMKFILNNETKHGGYRQLTKKQLKTI
jgi:hypothetical protein